MKQRLIAGFKIIFIIGLAYLGFRLIFRMDDDLIKIHGSVQFCNSNFNTTTTRKNGDVQQCTFSFSLNEVRKYFNFTVTLFSQEDFQKCHKIDQLIRTANALDVWIDKAEANETSPNIYKITAQNGNILYEPTAEKYTQRFQIEFICFIICLAMLLFLFYFKPRFSDRD